MYDKKGTKWECQAWWPNILLKWRRPFVGNKSCGEIGLGFVVGSKRKCQWVGQGRLWKLHQYENIGHKLFPLMYRKQVCLKQFHYMDSQKMFQRPFSAMWISWNLILERPYPSKNHGHQVCKIQNIVFFMWIPKLVCVIVCRINFMMLPVPTRVINMTYWTNLGQAISFGSLNTNLITSLCEGHVHTTRDHGSGSGDWDWDQEQWLIM